jgi:hypothetical protein
MPAAGGRTTAEVDVDGRTVVVEFADPPVELFVDAEGFAEDDLAGVADADADADGV